MAEHDDPKQRHYLELYKLGTGPLYSFYTPYHLCHFEVPITVARAALLGDAAIRPAGAPQVDVVTVAKTDLPAGTELDRPGGYHYYGEAERADVTHRDRLLPLGLAEGARLLRDVARTRSSATPTWSFPPAGWSIGCAPSRTSGSSAALQRSGWRSRPPAVDRRLRSPAGGTTLRVGPPFRWAQLRSAAGRSAISGRASPISGRGRRAGSG